MMGATSPSRRVYRLADNGDVVEVVSVSTREANGVSRTRFLSNGTLALTLMLTPTLTTQIGAPALAERLFLVQLPVALTNSS
jgi:hypothetical protein